MTHYRILTFAWMLFGGYLTYVYLVEVFDLLGNKGFIDWSEVIITVLLVMLSASSAVIAFWFGKGKLWARLLLGLFSGALLVICVVVIWALAPWGFPLSETTVATFGILLSIYTLAVFLKNLRANAGE